MFYIIQILDQYFINTVIIYLLVKMYEKISKFGHLGYLIRNVI
jgi:hypothetical protein